MFRHNTFEVMLQTELYNSVLAEGEICQITGPAAQLVEDRPLQISGMY